MCVYICMYVCVYVRHAQKIAKLFFSVRSTQFPFKLKILFIKKYINLLGPKTLRTTLALFGCIVWCIDIENGHYNGFRAFVNSPFRFRLPRNFYGFGAMPIEILKRDANGRNNNGTEENMGWRRTCNPTIINKQNIHTHLLLYALST